MPVGLVCSRCDALVAVEATRCPVCQAPMGLAVDGRPAGGARSAQTPPPRAGRSEEMMAMSTIPCPSCGHVVPVGDKFCGQCGNRMEAAPPPAAAPAAGKTMFFANVQLPSRAKLVLVKGDTMDGVAYQLNGTEHVVGRSEGAILFGEDTLLSPRHANFIYRDTKLFVRDEASQNGVFVRIRSPASLESGAFFLIGEQLLQIEASAPDFGPQPDAEGTYFYASPKRASKMRLIQRLRGGEIGIIYRARGDSITIGRESNDVNFPDDPYISGHHAEISTGPDGRFTLTDLGSKNGTYVRITDEAPLASGDFVFLGQQLLRVEMP